MPENGNPQPCAECGRLDGRIQHVDIAWPLGQHFELWLHPQCEAECIERLERNQTTARAIK